MVRVRLGTMLALMVCQPMLLLAAPPARTDVHGDPLPDGVRVRMGTIQLRHSNADVTFAADGTTMISCGDDGMVRYWDMASGKLVRRKSLWKLEKDKGRYRNVTLARDGKTAAAREDDKVYLYDVESGRAKGILALGPVLSAWPKLSPNGKLLTVETQDGQGHSALQLWDVAAAKKRPPLSSDKDFTHTAFSPRGDLLATRTFDNVLQLWDTTSGKEVRSIQGVGWGMTFSPDGKTIAALGGDYSTVHLWDIKSGKDYATLPAPDDLPHRLVKFAFSADGSLLAGVAQPGAIVWDVASRKVLRQFPEGRCMATAFAPDGRTLACWGFGNEIRLWDVATGKQKHERPGHAQFARTLAVSPDGKIVASGALHDPRLHLWDAATGRLLQRLKGGDDWIQSCVFSADGKQVVSCGCRGAIQLWDVAAAKEVLRLDVPGSTGNIRPYLMETLLHFAPDGQRLNAIQVFGSEGDARVYVWDTAAGKLLTQRLYKIDVHRHDQLNGGYSVWIETHAAFAPDGKAVTVRREKRLAIEETKSGRTLALLPENVGRPVAFSPDGQLVAAGILKPKDDPFEVPTIEGVCLIESATGQEVLRIKTGEGHLLDFSADGRSLATIDKESIHIWDVSSGAERFRRTWPVSIATRADWAPVSVAFLPDGGGVVTGMNDGALLVWDVPARRVKAAAKTPDGKTLETLWSDLTGDAGGAHRAIAALTATPAQSVPFLADRLRPAAAVEAKRLTKLRADLDSEQFPVREAAAEQLLQLSDDIEPTLRRFLQEKPSLEARRRLETILASDRPVPRAATLRTLRAIRVLESIGTAEARKILSNLAEGAAEARTTRAAKSALERLARH